MVRTIRMKKFPSHTHNLTFSLRVTHSWRLGAGNTYLPTGIRTPAVPYESTPALGPHIYPVWAKPYEYICCNLRMPLRTSRTLLPEGTLQYAWCYARYDPSSHTIRTRALSDQMRYVRYVSITYVANYITYMYHPLPLARNVMNPEQSEKWPFRYKSRRISHSSHNSLVRNISLLQLKRTYNFTEKQTEL